MKAVNLAVAKQMETPKGADELGSVVINLHEAQAIRAQKALQTAAKYLRDSREYPAGTVEVKDNMVVLSSVPFSGGEIPLYGIKKNESGIWLLENYEEASSRIIH